MLEWIHVVIMSSVSILNKWYFEKFQKIFFSFQITNICIFNQYYLKSEGNPMSAVVSFRLGSFSRLFFFLYIELQRLPLTPNDDGEPFNVLAFELVEKPVKSGVLVEVFLGNVTTLCCTSASNLAFLSCLLCLLAFNLSRRTLLHKKKI